MIQRCLKAYFLFLSKNVPVSFPKLNKRFLQRTGFAHLTEYLIILKGVASPKRSDVSKLKRVTMIMTLERCQGKSKKCYRMITGSDYDHLKM